MSNQVFNEIQELYHHKLLENIDDFKTILRLFTNAGSSLTESERTMLSYRKQKEWAIIRGCMEDLGQNQKNIPAYEEMMVKLGI